MILIDANILLYAEDSSSTHHSVVRTWWDAMLSGTEEVTLCWPVLTGFLRIVTNPKVLAHPLTPEEACSKVTAWLGRPSVRLLNPSPAHWLEFERLIHSTGATGNLLMDAHLAAIALEHRCALASCDSDFAKFPGLSWINPIGS